MPTDFSNANRQPMQQLYGTQAEWDNAPKPVLAVGQFATTIDTARVYFGATHGDQEVGEASFKPLDNVAVVDGVSGDGLVFVNSGQSAYSINGRDPVFSGGQPLVTGQIFIPGFSLLIWPATSATSRVTSALTSFLLPLAGTTFSRLDLRGCSDLNELVITNANCSEVLLAPGLNIELLNLTNNNLSAVQLNRIANVLGETTSGQVAVTGNPGASTFDNSILIDKGYTVTGV